MATDYYTLDEVCEVLGLAAAEVKAMVADGRLHEFRDAGRIFFKRAEVDRLSRAAKEGSSIVNLVADDEAGPQADETETFASALSSLADSSSGLGLADVTPRPEEAAELGLADESPTPAKSAPSPLELSPEDFPESLPAAAAEAVPVDLSSEIDLVPAAPSGPAAKPGSARPDEVPDLGLSGSSILNLEAGLEEAAPARPAPSKPARTGISVFEDDEVGIAADPMGETRISAGVDELEVVGTGSGLLDLTQAPDDSSLGQELLNVISPTDAAETETEEPVVEAAETVEDSAAVVAAPVDDEPGARPAPAVAVAAPRAAAYAAMAGAGPLNIGMLIGVLCLALLGLATAAQLQGVWPGLLNHVARDVVHYAVFGGLGLVAIVTGVLSLLAERKG
jgi:hypothetical protein